MPRVMVKKTEEPLTTEYLDLYYMYAFDTGSQIDCNEILDYLINKLSHGMEVVALGYVPLPRIDRYSQKGWSVVANAGTWIRPICKVSGELSVDLMLHVKYRAFIDIVLMSEEYLEKGEIARFFMGSITIDLSTTRYRKLRELRELRGYLELLIHQNGVMVLTLRIPIHGIELSSRDVMYLRYLLEVRGASFRIPKAIYNLWTCMKKGITYTFSPSKSTIKMRFRVIDVLEIFSLLIKYLLLDLRGYKVINIIQLENLLRNPWDSAYTVLFTEVLKGEMKFIEVLREYSAQIYAMLRGPRRLISRRAARRAISKSFRYIPLVQLTGVHSRGMRRYIGSRVSVLISESDTHIVTVSKRYLGVSEIGERLRLLHVTVLELANHARQCLRVFEHLFTSRRPRNLEELTKLRELFSKVIDSIENSYFIVDNDMKELFRYCMKALELRRLINSVERKFESLSYVIMTRYQDRISKMQVLLSVLFGVFGIPFFLFSYFQWLYDVALEGESQHIVEVTLSTCLPMIPILLMTIYLYYRWSKEVFR
ncbi:MAG: hypothetical protein DRO15_04860 [Thermoprotei archaeon]|nr:MAG: hypothetical protein DRO15_04860 [Thermoprotei archaeon]